MFWECHTVTSSIDKLLDQPLDQLKLQDFLDESDLIQECLNQNRRLIDYLIQENVMNELIQHVITLPNDDNFRNAHVVTELLSGDFQAIQQTLLEKTNLDLLYSFLLKNNETLNPILASYFSRIISTLINRKPNELINYLKSRTTFRDDVFRHLDCTSIIDVIYRLIADSGEKRSDIIKWYEEISLIDGLMQELFQTELASIQANIANLLCEFLRLAFDQQLGNDCDIIGPTLSSTIERLLNQRNEMYEGSSYLNQLSSGSDDDKTSTNADGEEKLTPLILAQRILSKSNLEQYFDALIKRPILVTHGYEFLHYILDVLYRNLPAPKCVSLLEQSNGSSTNKNENEEMQINDDEDNLTVTKSNENTSALANLTKDPLIHVYLILLEVIPSRLPSLIALLSSPCPPLVPSSNENTQAIKYQFISEPLGSIRLNLIKFFSKLIQTISNDYTGDSIYDVLNSNRFLHILIELFLQHIYNNFLHTQVYLIVRLLIQINSSATNQPDDIWTRTSIKSQTEVSNASPYYYTNRYSYKFFQSLLSSSDVNLFERLLDQYEINIASTKSVTTSSSSEDALTSALLHTSFVSPNSGHIAQILRFLRDNASTFNNYGTFFKSNDQQIDDDTNVLEIRWQTALDYLNEDEKKWAAMHYTEHRASNFRVNSSASYLTHMTDANDADDDNEDENQLQNKFHIRSFTKNSINYNHNGDDDDDEEDEIERFDIDDELMKNDETSSERKVADMKKISFQLQFPSTFNEQSIWYQQEENNDTNKSNGDDEEENSDKMRSTTTLPDLFENHRTQHEKSSSSSTTESNFEQLCSLRANDKSHGSGLFSFQSSSTIRDEVGEGQDEF